MFTLRNMPCCSPWNVFLFLNVVFLALSVVRCYDPCPENLRQSARPCNIPDSEIEKAFQEAQKKVQQVNALEKKLAGEGRVVNTKIKSAESTHPQANSPPAVRQREQRQLVFEEASNILAQKYKLNARDKCCNLPRVPLRTASAARAVRQCVSNDTIRCDSSSRYRTADGTCNNLNNPTWGSALSCFSRLLLPSYTENDGFRRAVDGGPLPEPRTISLNVHRNFNRPTTFINHLLMFFGQFLDHDMTLTSASTTENNEPIECCPPVPDNHPQCAPIAIQRNDPFYSRFNVTCLNFVRSALCAFCTAGSRAQVNALTAFIDASMIYGNSLNETNSLRANDGSGRLRTQDTSVGQLPPRSPDPANDQCSFPAQNQICFQTGDPRSNQHPGLISLQTLFLREHNRRATALAAMNPQWNEERIFQEARKIVGAEMQAITYKEFLPVAIGSERMSFFNLWVSRRNSCTRYNATLNPSLLTEFSTVGFRFGHTLINSQIARVPGQSELLRDVFFEPFGLYTGDMDPVLRGSTRSSAQWFDRHMVDDVTDFLYRIAENRTGLDLASFNIQRGRDHGVPPYIDAVRYCSMNEINIQSFDDLVRNGLMTSNDVNILRNTYVNVGDIDMFTGCITEIWNNGAVIGPTATCLVGIQFHKLKFGDRFYFEHCGEAGSFTLGQINELRSASLARVLCDNTGITEIQPNAMLFPDRYNNPVLPCSQIPNVNLEAWRGT